MDMVTAMLVAAISANGQTKPAGKTTDDTDYSSSFDIVHNDNGSKIEKMQMHYDGRLYRAVLVNDKITELYIDGEKIPAADWNKHQDAIDAINAQLARNREQAKRNAEQAKRNEEQAARNKDQEKRNEEQAVKNQEQAKRNEEQAARNKDQEKRNAEQAIKNREQDARNEQQAVKNEQQAKHNEEQVARNKVQEERNAEQAIKNQEQAVRNEEQAKRNKVQEERNAEQAERNKEQAEANARFIKSITSDLIADKIIPDGNSLHGLTLNSREMIVNGVKQPDAVFKKYAQKFKSFFKDFDGNFSFSDDGTIKGD